MDLVWILNLGLGAGLFEDKSLHIYFCYKNMKAYIERDMEATYTSCEWKYPQYIIVFYMRGNVCHLIMTYM